MADEEIQPPIQQPLPSQSDDDSVLESKTGCLVVILLIALGLWFFFKSGGDGSIDPVDTVSSSDFDTTTNTTTSTVSCREPSNPYTDSSSGQYAGYIAGAQGDSCSGNTSAFMEGCEMFNEQQETYANCLKL